MKTPTRVYRGPNVAVWAIPGSSLTIMWGGPGSGLRIGQCLQAGGSTVRIEHPTACDSYYSERAAREAVAAFISAGQS